MRTLGEEEWKKIEAQLSAPFAPEDVEFRVLQKRGSNCDVAAYINRDALINRLNAVCGCGNWEFDITPLVIDSVKQDAWEPGADGKSVKVRVDVREMTRAKGTLTIYGVSKSSVGDGSNVAVTKGCDSDAFKRAATMFGIAGYLYKMKGLQVGSNEVNYGRIDARAIYRLRSDLPVPEGYIPPEPPPQQERPQQPQNYRQDNQQGQRNQGQQRQPQGGQQGQQNNQQRNNPGAGNVTPQKQKLIADLASKVLEMGLPVSEQSDINRDMAIAKFLGVAANPDQFTLGRLSIPQLNNAIAGIGDGRIVWR